MTRTCSIIVSSFTSSPFPAGSKAAEGSRTRGRQEGPRGSQGANTDVTAFIASLVVLAMMVGIVFLVGIKRKPGTPTTWGEAFIAATFVFAILLMIYGIVPDRWLRWADGELKWRSDSIGIPVGPFHFLGNKENVLFGDGITFFGRGRVIVSKQVIRDIVA